LDISNFSSLIMGTVSFKALVRLGLANISDKKYTKLVNEIFKTEELPMCLVTF
jgi:hypothetical protein